MSHIPSKNTNLEKKVVERLNELKMNFERNSEDLPGKPDIVFRERKIAFFLDGDFWHGWHYIKWKNKVSAYWQTKIERNRKRDANNFKRLKNQSWKVKRFWGHQITNNLQSVINEIVRCLNSN